ncbi:MAG: GGDEF domain-containing protein [Oscillospiraceae bacterium]|nr:GGDEF domain-containing protein [Oscillospiraceae bacterium]
MTLLEKLKENRIPPKAYREFEQEIAQYNLNALRQLSLVGTVGGAALVLASLPPLRLLDLLEGYIPIMLLFAAVLILSSTVLKRWEKAILPVYYVFISLLLMIAIAMGTYLGRTTNATTFVMLVTVLPLFIIDRPIRMNLIFGAAGVLFCFVDMNVKTGQVRDLDLANCIVFYLISVVVSRQTVRAKMSDIIVKRELKQQRDMDMLTKLSNRGAFERIVARYIHESNKNAIMLIMDLDNFKSVNDTMGHAYGDMVLQLVGEYLRGAFRSSDTVSRLGGDEFVAFLPAVGSVEVITGKVQGLVDRIAGIEIPSDRPCRIGASVGLAQYPDDGCTFEELYKRADLALYAAKKKGKGCYMIYDPAAENISGVQELAQG